MPNIHERSSNHDGQDNQREINQEIRNRSLDLDRQQDKLEQKKNIDKLKLNIKHDIPEIEKDKQAGGRHSQFINERSIWVEQFNKALDSLKADQLLLPTSMIKALEQYR